MGLNERKIWRNVVQRVVEHRISSRMKHLAVMAISSESSIIKIMNVQRSDPEQAIMEILKEKLYEDYIKRNDVLYKFKATNCLSYIAEYAKRNHSNDS